MTHDGGGQVVRWSPPAEDGGAVITSYVIETSPHPPDQTWEVAKTTWNVSSCRVKLTQAMHEPASTYQLRIAAVNEVGLSLYSEVVEFTTGAGGE